MSSVRTSKNLGHSVGENAKGAHREVYTHHTSVISAHFFDQVQVFFFFLRTALLLIKG